MVHTYACTQQEKRLEEEKPINTLVVDGRPDTKISGVSYFLSSSVAFRIVYSVYIYFYNQER